MRTDFVLDELEQALYARQPERDSRLIHHSDRGSQYVSIRYNERLAEAGVEPSVGSKGDSYDNALAETIMSRAVHNDVLDAAFNVMASDCDRITFCVGQPTTYAEAVTAPGTGKMLVDHGMSGGDFTIGDAAEGGRQLLAASQIDTVSNTGVGNHIALVDTVGSRLLYVTPASEQRVVAGHAFEFPEWRIRLTVQRRRATGKTKVAAVRCVTTVRPPSH